jgi:DNA-binding MarR family transcriptional regulator
MVTVNNDQRSQRAPGSRVGLSFLLSQVGAHAAIRFEELLGELDLKPHDAGILRVLKASPGITQEALSSTLGVFPSRLVLLLDRLQARKGIDRRRSATDRRSHHLYLTPKGRTMSSAVERCTRQLEKHLFAGFSAIEKQSLFDLLGRIVSQQRLTPGVHPAYSRMEKLNERVKRT